MAECPQLGRLQKGRLQIGQVESRLSVSGECRAIGERLILGG